MRLPFVDREPELRELDAAEKRGGLLVVYGRRRVGKTRLLRRWLVDRGGLYSQAIEAPREMQVQQVYEDLRDGLGARIVPRGWAELLELLKLPGSRKPVRRISADLRPLMLDDLGLQDAVGWLVEDFAARSGIECKLTLPPEAALEGLERGIANTVYRVLQESLTNVLKHARAKEVRVAISLAREPARFVLAVADDGGGFDSASPAAGRGLSGMRRRAEKIGAALEIASDARGTRISLAYPLAAAA